MDEYKNSQIKSLGTAYIMFFLFGSHYLYLEKPILQIIFWFTIGGFGFWALIDLFTMPDKINSCNMKILSVSSNNYEFTDNEFIPQNGYNNNYCKICNHEIIIGEYSCSFCDKKRKKIELILKDINYKLDIFNEINIKKEKQHIRIEILEKIRELKAFDSKILKLAIKNDKLLTNIEDYVEDKEEERYLEQKKKLSKLSSNLINLLEKAEKYNFIKVLEKERLAMAEVLYYIKKNDISESDLEYIKTENNNNIEESFFSMEYLKNRVEHLEKVLNID